MVTLVKKMQRMNSELKSLRAKVTISEVTVSQSDQIKACQEILQKENSIRE